MQLLVGSAPYAYITRTWYGVIVGTLVTEYIQSLDIVLYYL